jgi:hypothetical protein
MPNMESLDGSLVSVIVDQRSVRPPAKGSEVVVRIAVIGGLERHEAEISRRADILGHAVEFHRGRVGGRHAGELESMVQRCELTIIVTQVNSHGAMYIAKKAAARHGRPALHVRTCSPSSFSMILDSFASRAPTTLLASGE